jgi:hypothetical protein
MGHKRIWNVEHVVFEPEKKTFISPRALIPCLIALSVRRNPQHRSLLTVVSATSAPPFQLRHQRNVCHPVVHRFTRQTLPTVNRKHFLMNILCTESFCPQKNAQHNATLRQYTPQARSPFWLLKPASEHAHAHARLFTRLSWSWTVLLPCDAYRRPITSITAVLLSFVTYLLTLPRTQGLQFCVFCCDNGSPDGRDVQASLPDRIIYQRYVSGFHLKTEIESSLRNVVCFN